MRKLLKDGQLMSSSAETKSPFPVVCARFIESFNPVNSIKGIYQCKIKENQTVTRKKEVNKALDEAFAIGTVTIQIIRNNLDIWKAILLSSNTMRVQSLCKFSV